MTTDLDPCIATCDGGDPPPTVVPADADLDADDLTIASRAGFPPPDPAPPAPPPPSPGWVADRTASLLRRDGVLGPQEFVRRAGQSVTDTHLSCCNAAILRRLRDDLGYHLQWLALHYRDLVAVPGHYDLAAEVASAYAATMERHGAVSGHLARAEEMERECASITELAAAQRRRLLVAFETASEAINEAQREAIARLRARR